ncbi:MAG: hypothetical protein ACRDN6_08425 [Gaiellaceae bacterium]
MSLPLAHGIAGVKDLPVPLWLFFYGAGVVLIVSFVALGALWRRPLLAQREPGRPLPTRLQRVLAGPELRVVLGLLSVGLLALVFAAAVLGEDSIAVNLAPTFVWVLFWLGLVPVVVLIGNVWSVLSPWRAAADGVAWAWRRLGRSWTPPWDYPERLGRWPAAVLLFAFTTLELAYPDSSSPRTLAIAIALYSWITWLGMAAFGRRAWTGGGEAFAVYCGLLARLSPFDRRGRVLVARMPLSGLAGREERPGTIAFVTVMLGSVAFDGFSRTTWWQTQLFAIDSQLALERPRLADLAITGFNLAGLLGAVAAVSLLFLLAVEGARLASGRRDSLAEEFVSSLVPIALAYAVAHYFSLFVLQGQVTRRLVSDPFGFGWDLFGSRDYQPNLTVLSPNTIWYVQVAALVVGHVIGLVLAHDRAVALFRSPGTALRTQYAMLVLMVAYTVGGLWLLSNG